MSEVAEKLKAVLAALSTEDRAEIVRYLKCLEQVDVETDGTQVVWDAEWAEELDRRVEAIRSGQAKMIPGDEVMRRLRERFG